jgi:Cof subfamily protein (haloacid dehalogenase superfamily)
MFKLIALDMDGTLLNEQKKISKANYDAIQKARKKGIKVILASGRPLVGFNKYLNELKLISDEDFAVAFNGALVQSTKNEKTISKTTLNLNDYKDLYELSKKLNVNIHALTENTVMTPKNSKYTELESEINNIPIEIIDVDNVAVNATIVKVMFVDEPTLIDTLMDKIPKNIKDKYTIVRSAPFFLEFLDKSVNKGTGVSAIAKKLNIKQEEVICIGDAGNDIHMIKYAGLGVAMGNAFPEVKKSANYITYTNEKDGVAHVINKFILKEDNEFIA